MPIELIKERNFMENLNNENEQKNVSDCKPYYCKHHHNIARGFIIPTFILSLLCLVATVINLGFNLTNRCDKQKCMMPIMNPGFSQQFNNNFGNSQGNSFDKKHNRMFDRDFSDAFNNDFGKNFGNNNDNNNNSNSNSNSNNNNKNTNRDYTNADGTNKRPPESKGPTIQNENVEPRSPR